MHRGHALLHEGGHFGGVLLKSGNRLGVARGLGDHDARRRGLDRRPDVRVVPEDRAQGVTLHGQAWVNTGGDLGVRYCHVVLE
jgi:hypothetical protein